jgi:DNA replication protein DnaC
MNNKTVADVIADYRNERISRQYTYQFKTESIPGMPELKLRKRQILQQIIGNSIQDQDIKKLEQELKDIAKKEAALLKSIELGFNCSFCHDTGFRSGTLCNCLRDKIYTEAYGALDIDSLSESFESSDRSKFSADFKCNNGVTQKEKYIALEKYAIQYADHFPNNKFPNILMTGKTGLGKTFILRSIAKRVHEKGGDVMLMAASGLFSVFHRHRLGFEIDLDPLFKCSLLLIDDMGAEPLTHNVTLEYLLDLLNNRIDLKKHMVIATNLTAADIIAKYGERIYSRIRFNTLCGQMVFEGQDIRIK